MCEPAPFPGTERERERERERTAKLSRFLLGCEEKEKRFCFSGKKSFSTKSQQNAESSPFVLGCEMEKKTGKKKCVPGHR